MAYDEKFRMCVIEYKDAGHTFKEVYEAFSVDSKRYYAWKDRLDKTGSLEYRPIKEHKRKIDKEELLRPTGGHPGRHLPDSSNPQSLRKSSVCGLNRYRKSL